MIRALLVAALLSGCAPVWVHPTKTAAHWEQDAYECERDAAAVVDPYRSLEMRKRCMRVKGWREQ